ncbi:MAG: alpha/beta hydrolase [Gammaproteobacteria bacterium]
MRDSRCSRVAIFRFLLLIAVQTTAACTPLAFGVLNLPARFGDYTLVTDLAYAEGSRRKLDIYSPEDVRSPRPVIVFFYGGRWQSGSKGNFRFVADAMTALGYIVVIPDYRLYPQVRFPAFVDDAARVVAWTHANIDAYGGDPGRLFVMGHSAGAHLAAMVSLDENYRLRAGGVPGCIAGMIGLAGPYDFLPLEDADLREIFGPEVRYPLSQPINYVNAGQPPLLLLHGADDAIVAVRNSLNLAAASREEGAEAESRVYEGIGHVGILIALSRPFRGRAPVVADVHAFIRGVLARKAQQGRRPAAHSPPRTLQGGRLTIAGAAG